MMTDDQRTCQLLLHYLKQFPLFEERHRLLTHKDNDSLLIMYRTAETPLPDGTTHFDLELAGDTCHLIYLERDKSLRGKGYGRLLYGIVEHFCRAYGCRSIRLTPSDVERHEYWFCLGFRETDEGELEKVLSSDI